ncbi:PIG-L family deacetylase [Arthrobacter sp. E3]|uniref:PIG-L family deacetylase n=1 Tax=Arthrobacter sp. E3 TaxID=517402 RepID=UPI001A94A5CD|nr:PIG-L family deacetylase [Arthrobacter sp. E3]
METPALLPGAGPDATILFVHAHPDDETIVTGASMAASAAAGARVVLLTCTRGELGEVIPAELAHLEVKAGNTADGSTLAAERERELAAALAALGIHEHLWLGQGLAAPSDGPVVFRDSGMQWGPAGRAMAASRVLPGSLSRAPLAETAELMAAAIRELRPTIVITYAADGGYGHPDHVRTHELTMAALRLAAAPTPTSAAWRVSSVYTIVSDRPERPLETGVTRLAVAGDLAAKTAAMAAHKTQITVDGDRYALSDNVWKDISAVEEFVAVDPAGIYPPAEPGGSGAS